MQIVARTLVYAAYSKLYPIAWNSETKSDSNQFWFQWERSVFRLVGTHGLKCYENNVNENYSYEIQNFLNVILAILVKQERSRIKNREFEKVQ